MNSNFGFNKEERSSFPYWFAHWCAFNMTALNLHIWKFKYLFHDIEKPWLRLFLPYEKVQKIHRKLHGHHLPPKGEKKKMNWIEVIIDWECGRFTKQNSPLTARQYVEYFKEHRKDKYDVEEISKNMLPLLDKLGL